MERGKRERLSQVDLIIFFEKALPNKLCSLNNNEPTSPVQSQNPSLITSPSLSPSLYIYLYKIYILPLFLIGIYFRDCGPPSTYFLLRYAPRDFRSIGTKKIYFVILREEEGTIYDNFISRLVRFYCCFTAVWRTLTNLFVQIFLAHFDKAIFCFFINLNDHSFRR